MFGIGLPELLVILAVALIVLGPKRIPEAARSLGRGLAEFRRATSGIADEFQEAQQSLEDDYRGSRRDKKPEPRPAPGAVARAQPDRKAATKPLDPGPPSDDTTTKG